VAPRPLIGIQLPEVEREVGWPEYLAIARAAEESGFDSVWVGDHLLYRDPDRGPWEAWTLLAALAAQSERVRLGPLVACTAFHPPGLIAKMTATLAEISAGRFVLGLGAGWNKDEFETFGLPYDRRVSRFDEAFTTIRKLLSGEDPNLLPRREAPLMIGSNGPRMLSIALPHVHAWNTWYDSYGNTAEGFAQLNARIDAAARDAGRRPEDITRSACAFVLLDRDAPERAVTPEAPPIERSDVAARVRELADAGADEVILVVSPITERSVRELGATLG
jgi:alkanesulfonate monooxygenase SsuD/methylene tetrahydromethanopterin reductase-like flavin-dependent oxidoreductase (luciferase family)